MANRSTCAYCGALIKEGQRWVREKSFEPAFAGLDPTYLRYHAELFSGQELSCWEKHQLVLTVSYDCADRGVDDSAAMQLHL